MMIGFLAYAEKFPSPFVRQLAFVSKGFNTDNNNNNSLNKSNFVTHKMDRR